MGSPRLLGGDDAEDCETVGAADHKNRFAVGCVLASGADANEGVFAAWALRGHRLLLSLRSCR